MPIQFLDSSGNPTLATSAQQGQLFNVTILVPKAQCVDGDDYRIKPVNASAIVFENSGHVHVPNGSNGNDTRLTFRSPSGFSVIGNQELQVHRTPAGLPATLEGTLNVSVNAVAGIPSRRQHATPNQPPPTGPQVVATPGGGVVVTMNANPVINMPAPVVVMQPVAPTPVVQPAPTLASAPVAQPLQSGMRRWLLPLLALFAFFALIGWMIFALAMSLNDAADANAKTTTDSSSSSTSMPPARIHADSKAIVNDQSLCEHDCAFTVYPPGTTPPSGP